MRLSPNAIELPTYLRSPLLQKKEELLSTRLRHAIRLNKDVRAELPDLEQDLRGKSTALTAEALKSKDLEDGQNLLLYAAALGTDVSFTSLVKVIKERVSMTTDRSFHGRRDMGGVMGLLQRCASLWAAKPFAVAVPGNVALVNTRNAAFCSAT